MTIKKSLPAAVVLALSTCVLAACGGGGSVRDPLVAPTVIPPPPPPPNSAPAEPCPPPIASDCVADVPFPGNGSESMTGGRQSDFALIKRGGDELLLTSKSDDYPPPSVDYRFSGGTTVEDGSLTLNSLGRLLSNVVVQSRGYLRVNGDVIGTVTNHGQTDLWATVTGNVINDGILTPGSSIYESDVPAARIGGDFSQTSIGTLVAVIGVDPAIGPTFGGYLSITGRADIDGTLRLVAYGDWMGPYPLRPAPFEVQVLHADGGVFGKFAQWTSPGLFITGDIRYLPNDVFFDATAISAATTMAAARAGDALTVASARNFDAALDSAIGLARSSGAGLSVTQRQFLASAAMIQRLQGFDQAIKAFDSLSGYGHAAVVDSLLQQASLPTPGLINHIGQLHSGSKAGPWSDTSTMLASGAGAFSTRSAGLDQWLDDRFLLGVSVGSSDGNLHFERAGGYARDQAPQWDVYFRRDGAGDSYAFGDIGYSHHQLGLDRRIDLGSEMSSARVMRDMDVTHAYVEAGRDFRILGSRLTPFAGLSYAALHAGDFAERGNTGFELVAQPSFHARLNAVAGLRMVRSWRLGDDHWMQLNLAAGGLQVLNARDDTEAAFSGTPDATFALAGLPLQRTTGWQQMSLRAGGENWSWLLSFDRQAGNEATSAGMQLRF